MEFLPPRLITDLPACVHAECMKTSCWLTDVSERDARGNSRSENWFDFLVKTCVVCFRIPTLYRALNRQSVWILNRTAQEAADPQLSVFSWKGRWFFEGSRIIVDNGIASKDDEKKKKREKVECAKQLTVGNMSGVINTMSWYSIKFIFLSEVI